MKKISNRKRKKQQFAQPLSVKIPAAKIPDESQIVNLDSSSQVIK